MAEYNISKITCAHDIYEKTRYIEKNFNTWYSLSKDKKPENYIWDEDMTVKQNREYTIQYNKIIDAEIKQCQDMYHVMTSLLNKHIYEYIIDNCDVKCSEKQAEIMWNYCEIHHEDDPHNYIDDVIELFEKLIEADK